MTIVIPKWNLILKFFSISVCNYLPVHKSLPCFSHGVFYPVDPSEIYTSVFFDAERVSHIMEHAKRFYKLVTLSKDVIA